MLAVQTPHLRGSRVGLCSPGGVVGTVRFRRWQGRGSSDAVTLGALRSGAQTLLTPFPTSERGDRYRDSTRCEIMLLQKEPFMSSFLANVLHHAPRSVVVADNAANA
jgi:hypothetical protein